MVIHQWHLVILHGLSGKPSEQIVKAYSEIITGKMEYDLSSIKGSFHITFSAANGRKISVSRVYLEG